MPFDKKICITMCERGKKKSAELILSCNSVFDAVYDFEDFKKQNCKDCPYKENSENEN